MSTTPADLTGFILGERIHLREVRAKDVGDRYRSWMNDPGVNQFLETRFSAQSIESIAGFVANMDGNTNSKFLAICHTDDNLHIGNIKVGPINWIHRHADVSLLIGERAYWGRGLASEAIELISRFSFMDLNLIKLTAGCYETNIGSVRAFDKAGYRKEGQLRSQWHSKGQYVDEILLGLTRTDWEARS